MMCERRSFEAQTWALTFWRWRSLHLSLLDERWLWFNCSGMDDMDDLMADRDTWTELSWLIAEARSQVIVSDGSTRVCQGRDLNRLNGFC